MLSKEDILSLGWKPAEDFGVAEYYKITGDVQFFLERKPTGIVIWQIKPNKDLFYGKLDTNGDLYQLMTWIGIPVPQPTEDTAFCELCHNITGPGVDSGCGNYENPLCAWYVKHEKE